MATACAFPSSGCCSSSIRSFSGENASGEFVNLRSCFWGRNVGGAEDGSSSSSRLDAARAGASVMVRAEVSTAVRNKSRSTGKRPSMVVDAIAVEKGKYGYEIECCINSLSLLPPRGSVTRCMDSYRNKLTMQDFAVIFREFAQRGDWHRALRLFKYMQRQQWCKPTEHIYTIMIGIVGREGLVEKCSEIFEDMPNNDVKWNVYAFTALINAYGRNGQHQASLQLLERMKKEDVQPNLITYNTVLNACAKGGLEWEGLLNLFAEMRHRGIQPDIITYNTLLSACCAGNLVEDAGMVFRTMNESGVVPDGSTYKSLVSTYENAGRLNKVEALFEEMVEEGNVPDVVGYNALIEAYANAGNVLKADSVFKRMQEAGCAPNISSYTMLLEAYGKEGSFSEVRLLFACMKALDATPDVGTYNRLIEVFGTGGYFKEAIALFQDMLKDEVQPDEDTYIKLLTFCGKAGLTREATEIHQYMLAKDATPSLQASAGLISSYGKMAMYNDVLLCYYGVKEAGSTPDEQVYDSMIEAYAKGGLYVEAGSTFWEKFTAGMKASLSTYNSLIEAYGRAGMFADSVQFFHDMHKAECTPDEKTHLALLNTYCAMGSFDEAKAQFIEAKELGQPSVSSYCLMLSICARRSEWLYARQLLDEMQRTGLPSLHVVVADLLQGKYENDFNWQIVEHAFDVLKLEDMWESMSFYNALLEVLVCFNQKGRAAKVLASARERGAFPEAFRRSDRVWSVDVHRMSTGAAITALLTWLNDLYALLSSGGKLPYMTAVVVTWGEIEEARSVQDLPLAKLVHSVLAGLESPFKVAAWNEGRLVCSGKALEDWLLHLGRLDLRDADLPQALLSRTAAAEPQAVP